MTAFKQKAGGGISQDDILESDEVTANAPTNDGYWTDAGNYATSFAGGTGTEDDPYLISTPQQLAYLSYLVNNSSTNSQYASLYYKQTANLDMSQYWWDAIGIYNYNATLRYAFSGHYNGGGYKISGLYTEAGTTDDFSYQGLFGCVFGNSSNYAEIHNVSLVDSVIQGYRYIGGIVGYSSYCNFDNCSNASEVSAYWANAGGIVGFASNGEICNSYNTNKIVMDTQGTGAGGIVGYASNLTIYNCYNLGEVCVKLQFYAGGLVGRCSNNCIIHDCYNKGNITGNSSRYKGGLVGYFFSGEIYNCYNLGEVLGSSATNSWVGGLIGEAYSKQGYIYNCFNLGAVYYTSPVVRPVDGGIVGRNQGGYFYNCYWGGKCESENAYKEFDSGYFNNLYLRCTDDNAKDINWYTNSSNWYADYPWDFENTWSIVEGMNDGYPVLTELSVVTISFDANGGSGTMAPMTVQINSTTSLSTNTFTRTGYSFSGWATSASGSKVYSNGQTITPTGNMTLYAVWVDNINPTISRVTYAQNGGTSYYAYAYASDSGSGLNRVQFPTWTANYDQDDIEWYTGTKGSWTVGGKTYNYRYLVQASNHGGEYGTYITHVYAYDNAGNSIGNGTMTNIRMTSSVKVNPNGGTYNGSSATSATTQNSGKTLGLNFARAGYNLSNVTSTAGTLSKSQVTGTMTFSGSNYVNLGRTYMYSNKLTWAVTAYMDNWSQYQSSNMRLISCTQTGGFNLEPNGSTVRFAVYDKARAGYNSITTSVTWASLSGWVQFAMVFDGHYARGYINGELVGTSKYEYTNGIGYHASNAIFIGAEASSNATKPAGNYFKGKIRSVHIINEAVNQEDLANLDNQYALYVKGNTTVTASWSVASYTVTYNANGGTLRNYNYATRTSNYSSTEGGVSVNYNATTGIATLNGTLTANIEITRFYDTFTAGTYTVGWEVIGGSMTRKAGCFAFEFVRDDGSGLTNRTNTDLTSTATSVSASMTLSSSMAPEADMLKLWIWYNGNASYVFKNLQLRVFAYLNTPAISSQKITHGTNVKMAYATRTGFYFSGWNTKADGTGTTYGPGNIGSITANTTLYAQWTARNEAKYDSAGKYWYVENGKIPQTKVTNTTLISNLNKATTNGANYYIAGKTLTAKVYSGKEYCKWNNNWYEVEPIKWRLDASSSQKDGYGTTTDTNAVLAEIVYVGQYSSSNIGSGAGYSSTAVTELLKNGIDTSFLSTYTTTTQTFGSGTTMYGTKDVQANMFVSSQSEITAVNGNLTITFSDLVKDIIKSYGGTNVYFTRDLGSNYNNITCFNEVGKDTQRRATEYRGVQFTVKFTEYGCVN